MGAARPCLGRPRARAGRAAALGLALALQPLGAAAESGHYGPYLGEASASAAFRFATPPREALTGDLARVVRESDVILAGIATGLVETRAADGRSARYEAAVQPREVLRGSAPGEPLRLRWEAATTGLEDGDSLLFFLRRSPAGWRVARSAYLYPHPPVPTLTLFGAVACDAPTALAAVRALAGGERPAGLGELLLRSFESERWHAWQCAELLALELDGETSLPLLRRMVAPGGDGRFDVMRYAAAIERLAAIEGDAGLARVVRGIPRQSGASRLPEAIAFDALARHGTPALAPAVAALVEERPELAVSAAFALAAVGGEGARRVLAQWQSDPRLASRLERMDQSGTTQPFAELFARALAKLQGAAAEAAESARVPRESTRTGREPR